MASAMLSTSWLLVLGAFVLVSWIASRVAHRTRSLGTQYAALGGFVVAEATIFVASPAEMSRGRDALQAAAGSAATRRS